MNADKQLRDLCRRLAAGFAGAMVEAEMDLPELSERSGIKVAYLRKILCAEVSTLSLMTIAKLEVALCCEVIVIAGSRVSAYRAERMERYRQALETERARKELEEQQNRGES